MKRWKGRSSHQSQLQNDDTCSANRKPSTTAVSVAMVLILVGIISNNSDFNSVVAAETIRTNTGANVLPAAFMNEGK